ncbi:uncharacterized protein LOC116208898 isoform X2 [Punica granatum]|uniref:Uncharacterized protein LOC116208898 isoform X2 n=1 Tax=Punica granatum TaxID=22663 RepID=A0A6P8DV99_PUNGR|nr:uncharacterized protein LOC116208898 isoform X2 [Punica granatum]
MATVPGVDARAGPSLPPAKRSYPEEEECVDREIVKKNRIEENMPKVEEDSSEEDDMKVIEYEDSDDDEGYDCGDLSKYKFQYWMLAPMPKAKHEDIKGFVVAALNGYNMDKGTQLVFESIEKATIAMSGVATYYITFVVKDPEDGDHPKTFQCCIHEMLQGFEAEQIRPKPPAA